MTLTGEQVTRCNLVMTLGLCVFLIACEGLVGDAPPPGPTTQPLVIKTASLPASQVQTDYQAQINTEGGTVPYSYHLAAGLLPAGLQLDSSSGVISGKPSQAGTSTFTVEVTDSSTPTQAASKSYDLEIDGPLAITTQSLAPARINQLYSATLTAVGGTKPYSWKISAGQLPPGVGLDGGTGALSGTPTQTGDYSFTAQVSDASSTASKQFPLSVAEKEFDQYGGLVGTTCAGNATGFFRTEKINGRWVFCTPEGNAFWAFGVSAVVPLNLGVDRNGKGYLDYIQQKYAIGQGPKDGFSGWKERWAYYTREKLRAWGFNFVSTFSHYPVVPDYAGTQPLNPPMGDLSPNQMPGVITKRSGGDAMRFGKVKNLYGPIFTNFANPFFPDVFDPAFTASVNNQASTAESWDNSPWVLFLFMDQTDEMRGVEATHPHLGFIAAATNFAVSSDTRAFGGAQTYTDTKMYTKLALRDFLKGRYSSNLASLNVAWGTSYTSWDSAGGWGTGTGFLDENGTHLGNWKLPDPQKEGFAAVRKDLDDFAVLIMRKWYQTVYDAYKTHKPHHLLSTNNMSTPHPYVYAGLRSADGQQVYADLIMISTDPAAGTQYEQLQRPFFAAIPFATAENDSPLAFKGTVQSVAFDESDPNSSNWRVVITTSDMDIWWAQSPQYKLVHHVWIQFSSLPPTIDRNGTITVQHYRAAKNEFIARNKFAVLSASFFSGTYDELKNAIKPGDTFRRMAFFHPDGPFETQEARAAAYQNTVMGVFNKQAPSGDHFFVGINHWSHSDTSWVGYFEAYNFGLVTLHDNAYDGKEVSTTIGTDSWGFRTGGEEKGYGDFISGTRNTAIQVKNALKSTVGQ